MPRYSLPLVHGVGLNLKMPQPLWKTVSRAKKKKLAAGWPDPGKSPSGERGLMQPKPGSECGIRLDQSQEPLVGSVSDTTGRTRCFPKKIKNKG